MKINDFRLLLAKADHQVIIKIASEIYKCLPKAVKEGYDGIDMKIKTLLGQQVETKNDPPQSLDFDLLHDEISTFLSNADDGYYLSPNRVVPKAQRSKWRFVVMRFLKDLCKIKSSDENYDDSNQDLIDIYEILSRSCGYYVFRTEDPFAAIGKVQSDFYKLICQRVFANGYSDVFISQVIDDATKVYLDRNTLYIELICTLIDYINDEQDITNTLQIIEEKIEDSSPEIPAGAWAGDISLAYSHNKTRIENLATLAMGLYFKIKEYNNGCSYYWKICNKYDIKIYNNRPAEEKKEVAFYCLLGNAKCFGATPKLWLEIYDKYKEDTKPRESLLEKYNEIKSSLGL